MTPLIRAIAAILVSLVSTGVCADLDEFRQFRLQAVEAQNAGDYVSAEAFHRKSLEATETIADFPPAERARAISNLASTLNLNGKPGDALALLHSAAAILDEHPSRDAGQYIALDINIATALYFLQRYDEAEEHCLKAMSQVSEIGAETTMYGAEARFAYARILWKTGRLNEAMRNYNFAIEFWRTYLPDTHPLLRDLLEERESVKTELKTGSR